MLHEFAGTPYEGDEGIHEESRGHRAFLRVLFTILTTPRQSRGNGSECVGSFSERETVRRGYFGMPRECVGRMERGHVAQNEMT